MQVEYTGRQVTVTPALKTLAEESMARIAKVLGDTINAHVVLTAEKYRQIAEITVKCKLQDLVGIAESTVMETALREALDKVETQAIRCKKKLHSKKRQTKDEKIDAEPELSRQRRVSRTAAEAVTPKSNGKSSGSTNGNGHAKASIPVTVHSFPAKTPIAEPHVVRSLDSVALRPMTLEEAVKEAEFRDREVFVFRDMVGKLNVLHRKRDGKMELIEAP
ncbi:MAG: ribosome-associated translation inhibitor RaiA [Acidobacteria bacterium]|nr:ribosome-associated translation inhibitor RaiA [Acidobacteriota bacterium]